MTNPFANEIPCTRCVIVPTPDGACICRPEPEQEGLW